MSFGTYANVAGTYKTVSAMSVKVSGAWKTITAGFTKAGGVWKQVFGSSLSASASPATASGTGSGGGTIITNSVTVTPTGGVAPYTHAWSFLSGDSAIFPVTPTNVPVQVWARGTPVGVATYNATFKDLITDAIGQQFTVNVAVTINAT